jgi:hypothetical protein
MFSGVGSRLAGTEADKKKDIVLYYYYPTSPTIFPRFLALLGGYHSWLHIAQSGNNFPILFRLFPNVL